MKNNSIKNFPLILIQLLFLFLGITVQSQIQFEEITGTPFEGVVLSSIAFSDIDGDNDPDVLITGRNSSNERIAKLYTNDGSGGFTEVIGTPFEGVFRASIAFSDIDRDNDPDVLITGQNSSNQPIAKLYVNDGSGDFTEMIGNPFDGVEYSSVSFSDIDGDNDPDVLITGVNSSSQRIAKLYTNDGSGNFTEVTGTSFEGVESGSIAFSDIDGDNDQDVLITGQNSSNQRIAKLYTNDGSGSFIEVTGTPFEGVDFSSIAFSDIDDDNDQDILITGQNSSFQPIAKLYTNDDSGNFTEVNETPFEGVRFGSIAFSDIDGDNDREVLITGRNSSNERIAKLYTNDGSGGFTEVIGTPFEGVVVGDNSIAFSDIDGDNDPDVLITGQNGSFQPIAKLYRNTTPLPCTLPEVPTLTVSPDTVCNGDTAVINISGALNDATAWHIYTDSCGGTEVGYTTTESFSIPDPIIVETIYYVRGEGGCVTPDACQSITITPKELDDTSFSYPSADYCVSDADPTPTITGLTGGSFSSNAGLSLNTSTGVIDLSDSTPGTYTVTYTTAGTCSNSSGVSVTINALDDASFSYPAADYCISDADPTPTITGLTGGSFSSTAGLSLDPITGVIDVSDSTAGTYTVTYTAAGTCPNSSDVDITINALDDASFSYSAADYCAIDADPTPTITGLTGGSFSSTTGLSIDASTGVIDVSASTPGTYTVTYTTAGTCPNSSDVDITIDALDDASFSYSASTYLSTDEDPTPTITGLAGGSFSSTAGLSLDANSGAIDLSASAPGVYTVTYTTAGTCPNSSDVSIIIVDCDLQASIQTTSVSCPGENDGALDLSITGGTAPYTFSWSNGAITEDIDKLAAGTYSVTITDNNGCETSASATLTVEDTEDPVLDCLSDQTITLTSDQTEYTLPDYVANGDVSATDNCNVSSISQTPAAGTVLTPGVYTISFTATDDSGNTTDCSFTLTVEETLGTTSVDLGDISLYPNPANQLLIIDNAQQNELNEMLVYDIQGRRVMQVELNSNASSITLDVSKLASATYTVIIKSENNLITRRLIKK
jgi:hypothetical protein